ncbi:MAG: dihydroorotate dehydrogenase electron transfer subunit [Lachnospiraceae bacterium]
MAKKVRVPIVRMERLEEGIFDMVVREEEIADLAKPGQFLSLYVEDASRLLPRPISICEINKEEHTLRMVFRVAGEGTRQLSMLTAGDSVEVMGPLGNGFYDAELKTAIVIGGGIGIPPMLELAKQLKKQGVQVTAVLGYRNQKTFLREEFEPYAEVVTATEDGSLGVKGNVIDAIREKNLSADMLFACGPTPMLRGVKACSEQLGIPAQISMEEKMACGIGACLACVCKTKEKDEHSQVNNRRICKDGPVFFAQDIEL